jgi:hypothetical protein
MADGHARAMKPFFFFHPQGGAQYNGAMFYEIHDIHAAVGYTVDEM